MSARIQLRKTHTLLGTLTVLTGLRVGAGKDTVEIGGMDNPVMKHPHTQEPYIPGSSLKGKLRSLLEWSLDRIDEKGNVYGTGAVRNNDLVGDPILRIFGVTNDDWRGGPTRLMVRDAHLETAWRDEILREGWPLTEEKTEVVIDRLQGKAMDRVGARKMERVPAGARFDVAMLFREFAVDGDEGNTDRRCLERVIEGLRLLQEDALGGSGSRGYGRVKFTQLRLNGKDIQAAFDGISEIRKDGPPVRLLE